MTVNNSSILDLQNYSHTLAGNIANGGNGSIDGPNSTLSLDADDAAQAVASSGTGSYSFFDLNIIQNGGSVSRTKTFASGCNLSISNDFTISNGSGSPSIMLLIAFNDNTLGGTPRNFTLGENCQFQTTHPDFYTAFTSKFTGIKTLDVNSSVYYSLNGSQAIANDLIYGNLTFNGGNKTALGPLDINGSLTASANTPVFYDGGFTHYIAGNWQLNNTAYYTASSATGTIVFDGANQTINGVNFNNMVVANSGTATIVPTTTTVFGNLTLESAAILDLSTKSINLGGNFWAKGSGAFTQSTGTTTFNGVSVQTVNSNANSSFGNFTITKPNAIGLQVVRVKITFPVRGTKVAPTAALSQLPVNVTV